MAMRKLYRYHAEATSVAGFLQVLTANYLPAGCVLFTHGLLKPHMNASAIDADIIARYDIAISKSARYWRKRQGTSAVHLLRYRLFYLILASEGRHSFFEREVNIKNARKHPIQFGDYYITFTNGHSSVRLSPQTEENLKDHFLGLACFRSAAAIAREFHALPYLAYLPVVSQELKILGAVNAKRGAAGMGPVDEKCLTVTDFVGGAVPC